MRSALLPTSLALLAACTAPEPADGAAADGPQRPPNVVFFLVDDLGWTDLGCFGSSFYETPHLDALAASGMRFTNAYAACPVCSPTRASLMTGKYPQRVGITDYISPAGTNQPDLWKRKTPLLPAPYADRLPLEEVTLAEAFGQAGYATFFAGKWHLGPDGWWPEAQGFDENQGGITRGGPYGGKKYFSPYGNPRLTDGPEGEHLPDRLAREAARFIEENRDRPFFAYVSFYSVHTPLLAREDLREKYAARSSELATPEDALWGREGQRKVRLVQEHAVYAGMVEAMDAAVGTVLARLDELGLADDTIVVFTSDNGGLSTSEGHPTSNLPLRGGKGWLYEGGVREPTIVRAPGVTAARSESDAVVTSPDFYPTLLELCGLPRRPEQHLDGASFVAALRGEPFERGPVFWHYPHYGNQGGSPGAAVRDGDHKLIRFFETNRVELYDLSRDPSEQHDLAAAEPAAAARLGTELSGWQARVGALFPTDNERE
ncbi:MAG: sulfatase [Planctomycetota bacterium]